MSWRASPIRSKCVLATALLVILAVGITGITIRTVHYTKITTTAPFHTAAMVPDRKWITSKKTIIQCGVRCLNKGICIATVVNYTAINGGVGRCYELGYTDNRNMALAVNFTFFNYIMENVTLINV